MKRTRALFAVVLTLGTAFLSGCLFVSAPPTEIIEDVTDHVSGEPVAGARVTPTGIIEGYVTAHLSGEPVAGTRVTAYPQGRRAPIYFGTSNAAGFYRLVVPEGLYTVAVRKVGHATSRAEGVKVGSTTRLDFVQKPVFNPRWSLEPPRVTVTGVTEGMTISRPITVTIEARGDNDIRLIFAAFGKTPGAGFLTAPRVVYSGTYYTGTFTIDPAAYGVAGETTFEVVVYDLNENRVHLIWRVDVERPALGLAPRPPRPLLPGWIIPGHIPVRTAMAVTLSRKLGFYAAPLDPMAAPPGGNLYVDLRWRTSLDDATITGYRIYRKLDGEPDFRLIYTVNRGATLYRDSTPDLKVRLKASYRIVAFRWDPATETALESAPLEAETTPIGAWDVRPLSPADNATGVDLRPTFTWQPINPPPGATLIYSIRIWDTPLGGSVVTSPTLVNVTSWTYPGIPGGPFERLQPQRMYQWQIRGAIAYDGAVSAVAVTANQWGFAAAFPTQVPPGLPAFTTRDW